MKSNYSLLDKALHYTALAYNIVPEALFDLEQTLFGMHASILLRQEHVFISGLARSGTTILMRALHGNNEFASLTYADMPFVTAPNLWAKMSSISLRKEVFSERAHGDGIHVSWQSPEALEEVFWRIVQPNGIFTDQGLVTREPDRKVLEAYVSYIRLICLKYGKLRYLSKNNNNIFRLPALTLYFPDSIFLIPYREPLSHAQSLLNQHRRFQAIGTFEVHYMTWLGHHEFGKTQNHYLFDLDFQYKNHPTCLEYWLEVWINTYSRIARLVKSRSSNVVLVGYEALCHGDSNLIAQLCNLCRVPHLVADFALSSTKPEAAVPPSLLDRALVVYAELEHLSKSVGSDLR